MPSRFSTLSLTLALAASLLCAGAAFAKDGSKLQVPLTRVGSDADITGSMRFQGSSKGKRFEVSVSGAAVNTDATLRVGGVDRLTLRTTGGGGVKFSFRSPANGGSVPLSFDPRGEVVEVWQNGAAQLSNTLASGSSGGGGSVSEQGSLTNTGAIPGASGHVSIREKKGEIDFSVEIEDVPNGSYDLFVGGIDRGTIVTSAGRGELEFSNGDDPGKLPLDFDPYGALVEVKQGATVILTGSAIGGGGAGGGGGNVCTPVELRLDLENVGPDPDAKGDARHRVRSDCNRDFRVEVEDLPDGSYDLVVGGVDRGDIVVVETAGEHRGEIEYDTDPDEVGKVLLTFDPRGQLLEVKQGATVFLSLAF